VKHRSARASQQLPPPPRVVIENVHPQIEGGRYPIKRVEGDKVTVTADIFADGHDLVSAVVLHRRVGEAAWNESPMCELGNDRWMGSFEVPQMGRYEYTLQGWVDYFRTWRLALGKKVEAGQDVSVDLLIGAELVEQAAKRAEPHGGNGQALDGSRLRALAEELRRTAGRAEQNGGSASANDPALLEEVFSEELAVLMDRHAERRSAATYEKLLPVVVDRRQALFSAWYEMFPRSCSPEPGRHGTFQDCELRLPYVAEMGFDVLYLPPIHPIGRVHRKGKNNAVEAGPEDVGSPWAIGSEEGGHKSVHPQLGTLEDFKHLVAKAREFGLEIALDLAFQCAPDHPYVKQHPEWFRHRPDGSIQYAENPPKKYEDIYPFDFECVQWRKLWEELKSIVVFWIKQGVRLFRVDNPHTKPFAFWEWLLAEIRRDYPDVLFLAEAFTRPRVMERLAKLGFTQSYTYFAWRNTKWELTQYLTELTQTELKEYYRPHFWPNTPDILTEYLQYGGRPAFIVRLVLAATLSAGYGIYGPAFELCENRPLAPGREEYLDAEKYEIKHWDITRPESLKDLVGRVNRIRRENPALQTNHTLRFHTVENEQLIAYTKSTEDLTNVILVVVNLDPHHMQCGMVELPLESLAIDPHQPYQVHDLLADARYLWQGPRNYVELHPQITPAHIFRIRRRVRTERDFDYFM
jgi:starch synthase (maltosyl-transferring)